MCMCLNIPKLKGRNQTQAGVLAPATAIVNSGASGSPTTPGANPGTATLSTQDPSITTAVITPAAPTPAPVTNAITLTSPSTPISGATTPTSPSAPIPPLLAGTAIPSSPSAPGITNSPPPILGSSNSSVTTSASLWEQALEKVGVNVLVHLGVDKKSDISLVQRIVNQIDQRKKECDEKRWFYINKKGEKIFYIEVLLGQLNRYALVGDIAIQHHPDIVALAWAGFRVLLQVGTAYTEAMQTVSESVDYIVHNMCCCDIYERLYRGRKLEIAEALDNSIVNLYASILEYLNYASKYVHGNTAVRIRDSFFSELGQLLGAVRVNKEEVECNVGIADKEASAAERFNQEIMIMELKKVLGDITGPIERIESAVETIYAMVKDEKRMKILEWLSDVKFSTHHSFSSARRLPGTGRWLLENEEFSEWRSSTSSSILWLRGDAGSGKTILASFIIDEFQEQAKSNEHVLAYFYCDYKQAERRDPASILRALVKQFCLKNLGDPDDSEEPGLLPKLVLSTYRKRERNGHSSGPLSPQESKKLIIKLSEKYLQTTIVLDALDECDPSTRREFFSILYDIVDSTHRLVKIFFTSRYDSDIAEIFAKFPRHYISEEDNSQDINMYINAEIDRRCDPQERSGAKKLLLNGEVDPKLKEKIISALKNRANGMFMWVHLQILALCEQQTPGGILEALDELPKDLKSTYDQILARIESQTPTSRYTAKTILGWLLYAREPCSTASAIQALAVNPREKTREKNLNRDILNLKIPSILSNCQNLVVHDKKLDNFGFAHFSVQEFLLHHPKFHANENHIYMAEVCLTTLTYLSSSPITNLIDYATHHWGTHVFLSGASTSTLQTLCRDFLRHSPAYTTWALGVTRRASSLRSKGSGVIPPLWVACYYRLYDSARLLLEDGENPNDRNYDGKTPLSWAAEKGHEDIVQLLLAKDGVDVNSKDNNGETPLSWAIRNAHESLVQLLLARDEVDVNFKDINVEAPLSWATRNDHKSFVQLLLAKDGVDVNSKDNNGETPLTWAVRNSYESFVQLILARNGVDVNAKDKFGWTPLSWACKNGHEKIVQLLLAYVGVDLNSRDKSNRTPLSQAVVVKGNEGVVKLMLAENGVDINSKDDRKRTPLFWAVESGREEIVLLLLAKGGVDVNFKDDRGDTPKSLAFRHGYTNISIILESQPITNPTNNPTNKH